MKYIVFKYKAGIYMPIMFPGHITHSQIKIEDAEPVSAGFCYIKNNEVHVTDMRSESLNLDPDPARDRVLLNFALKNMPVSFYLPL